MKQPYVVPSTARRDFLIGLAVGLILLGFAALGFMKMGGGIAGSTLDGVVSNKTFTRYEDAQVTFGKGGVHQIEGEYVLECDVKGHAYLVSVDKDTYNAKKVGDRYIFARPRE